MLHFSIDTEPLKTRGWGVKLNLPPLFLFCSKVKRIVSLKGLWLHRTHRVLLPRQYLSDMLYSSGRLNMLLLAVDVANYVVLR